MANMKGWYIPADFANSYVDNRRDETGINPYSKALSDIGLQKQAALQSLNKTYSDTINDAYSNYLNAKRGIRGSELGQGYKEAYLEQQDKMLQSNIMQNNIDSAQSKQLLLENIGKAEGAVGVAFQQEVENMQKIKQSLIDYLVYTKGLNSPNDLDNEERNMSLADLYGRRYDAKVPWIEWANSNAKSEKDRNWYNWMTGGGLREFEKAINKKSSSPNIKER